MKIRLQLAFLPLDGKEISVDLCCWNEMMKVVCAQLPVSDTN